VTSHHYAEDKIILLLYNTFGVSLGIREKIITLIMLTDTNKTETLPIIGIETSNMIVSILFM
jgi:hypothetical protein